MKLYLGTNIFLVKKKKGTSIYF